MNSAISPFLKKYRKPFIICGIVLGCILAVALAGRQLIDKLGEKETQLVLHTATKGHLPIVVTERGNLQSQRQTVLRCEVENTSRERYGTQIIFIVPDGSAVQEGDLLVELDSAAIRQELDQQVINHRKAFSQLVQARARFQNQILQNKTLEADAKLQVELSKLELTMYRDEEAGTYELAVEEIERSIDEAKNEILESRAALELQKTEKEGIEELFKLGYRGRSDVDQSHFKFIQAEDRLAASTNKLNTFQSTKKKLEKYDREMQLLTLNGAVNSLERSLEQVKNDNEANLAQAEAARIEAEETESKEKERLEKLQNQEEKCKIFAPHDGMVVYHREGRYNSTEVEEGALVRQRQELINLPSLTEMQVKTQIHEAVMDQVKAGQPVTVRVDALPDHTFRGTVSEVGVVPSSRSYYNTTKTYDAVIKIDGKVNNIKPGMTAVVDIHVNRLSDIVSVPVQSIVQRDRKTWCYVKQGKDVEKRMVTLGPSNDRFVQIKKGVSAGEQVVLNPMSILEKAEEESEIAPDKGIPELDADQLQAISQAQTEPSAERLAQSKRQSQGKRTKGKGNAKKGSSPAAGGE